MPLQVFLAEVRIVSGLVGMKMYARDRVQKAYNSGLVKDKTYSEWCSADFLWFQTSNLQCKLILNEIRHWL
jgi:hypothetical protein